AAAPLFPATVVAVDWFFFLLLLEQAPATTITARAATATRVICVLRLVAVIGFDPLSRSPEGGRGTGPGYWLPGEPRRRPGSWWPVWRRRSGTPPTDRSLRRRS